MQAAGRKSINSLPNGEPKNVTMTSIGRYPQSVIVPLISWNLGNSFLIGLKSCPIGEHSCLVPLT